MGTTTPVTNSDAGESSQCTDPNSSCGSPKRAIGVWPMIDLPREVDGADVDPCRNAPGDCVAMKELLEDDGDWMIM